MSLTQSMEFSTVTATADLLVVSRPGRVRHVVITGNTGTWSLRDGTDATGTVIGTFAVPASTAIGFEWPIQFATGLFIDATGTVTRISVLYE